MPNPLLPHGLQPTRLLCPWHFPGKDTGVGCHFFLQITIVKDVYQFLQSVVKVKLLSCAWLFSTPWTVAHQAPLSMEFSRQEYWSELPFPSPGDRPNPGIKPRSPTLQADTLPSLPLGKSPSRGREDELGWKQLKGVKKNVFGKLVGRADLKGDSEK